MVADPSREARRAIEAILMVTEEPTAPGLLAQLTEIGVDVVHAVIEQLQREYAESDRGFVLVEVAGGYRFQSHPDLAPYVERYVLEGQSARLSGAALETLAIVAYKQPISRAQIAAIRGVNVDGVVRTLEQRGYIDEAGRDPGPGNPVLFGTTDLFLEKLGLGSLDDLPPLAQFVPGADVVEQLEHGLRVETVSDVADLSGPGASSEPADEANGEPSGPMDAVDAEDGDEPDS